MLNAVRFPSEKPSVRDTPERFAAMVRLIVPLPVPDAPDLTVTVPGKLFVSTHGHPAVTVRGTVTGPPAALTV